MTKGILKNQARPLPPEDYVHDTLDDYIEQSLPQQSHFTPHQDDPYEVIRIPLLPNHDDLPPDIQAFRDQCASGVRQAVAMVTAMEHQLWWERCRRQQAEEDCKVLLGALHSEEGARNQLAADADRQLAETRERLGAGKLRLAADELPMASGAATTIQKHFRGMAARKEYEGHLKDILRGIDPDLDPDLLPVTAQHHISAVNGVSRKRSGGGAGKGLRASFMASQPPPSGLSPGRGDQSQQRHFHLAEVRSIEQRLFASRGPDAPPVDPMQFDIRSILKGSYPASTAQVVVALVRRCKELQAALLEVSAKLSDCELSNAGLRQANKEVLTLSKVRSELQAERQNNARLLATVSRLRNIITAEAHAKAGGGGVRRSTENPYVGAWYRKEFADAEFDTYPWPKTDVYLMDGPDAPVEMWDDLHASGPERVLIARAGPHKRYDNLLDLGDDLQDSAGPLYSSRVPDMSQFDYRRDTPMMPMQSPLNMMRESLPTGTYMDDHEQYLRMAHGNYRHPDDPYGPVREIITATGPGGYPPPQVPMYSVLPLIQDGEQSPSLDLQPEIEYRPPPLHLTVAEAAALLPTAYTGPGEQLVLRQRPPRELLAADQELQRQRLQHLYESAGTQVPRSALLQHPGEGDQASRPQTPRSQRDAPPPPPQAPTPPRLATPPPPPPQTVQVPAAMAQQQFSAQQQYLAEQQQQQQEYNVAEQRHQAELQAQRQQPPHFVPPGPPDLYHSPRQQGPALYVAAPSRSPSPPPREYDSTWSPDPEGRRFNYEQHTPQVTVTSPLAMMRDSPHGARGMTPHDARSPPPSQVQMRSNLSMIRDSSPQPPLPPPTSQRRGPLPPAPQQPYNAPGAAHTVMTLLPATATAHAPPGATAVMSPLPFISDRPVDPRLPPAAFHPQQASQAYVSPDDNSFRYDTHTPTIVAVNGSPYPAAQYSAAMR